MASGLLDDVLKIAGGMPLPVIARSGFLGPLPKFAMQQIDRPRSPPPLQPAPAPAVPQGLPAAAQQVQAMGRGPDTMLAHISPDEAKFIDYMQGGRKTNPLTGLPEYSQFGNILKAVARAAGAIGGFMIGGPAGAAVGAGAATKLTGGSWKDALGSAAMSGLGGELGQGFTGGGWNPIGGSLGGSSAAAGARGFTADLEAGGTLPSETARAVSPSFVQTAKSWPGIAAGLGANMGGQSQPTPPPMPMPEPNKINLNIVPQPRSFKPFPGDQLHAAEPGGGLQGYEFYDPLNPQPQYQARGGAVRRYDIGGPVVQSGPTLGVRGIRGGGADMPGAPGQVVNAVPAGGIGGIGAHEPFLRKAAMLGYMNAPGMPGSPGTGSGMGMARGGSVGGRQIPPPSPAAQAGSVYGNPTGGDAVPAVLQNNEHVIDSGTVALSGNGDPDAGHRVMENIKQEIRARAGQKNPKTPPTPVGMMVARAKRRAGVK